ncbi:pseudouridine synthase [Piptocephalis cylindrospora]|uniref:21S rRNA pseudouridine(2819) synthase n=1 Tax=Piptocephalis cylindrospora TaxID=1907219 RepID=A0A4P9Y0E1_9FUNG|nr:pseudouridine synthase [Piptocephalis cylindrospora]|eukprot:RKP12223.1 pseudouridine synthase [Piptocephalis cylindrospora]
METGTRLNSFPSLVFSLAMFMSRKAMQQAKKTTFQKIARIPPKVFTVTEEHNGMRLDKYLRLQTHVPTTLIHRLIRQNQVKYEKAVNPDVPVGKLQGKVLVQTGDRMNISFAKAHPRESRPKNIALSPSTLLLREALKKAELYVDSRITVINKPYGIPCQGGHSSPNLPSIDQALRISTGLIWEPGDLRLVHRLDMFTTGALILAKDRRSAVELTSLFRRRNPIPGERIEKLYASIHIIPPEMILEKSTISGVIDTPLALPAEENKRPRVFLDPEGKQEATTSFQCVRIGQHRGLRWAILALSPLTGRKHQLRVHCADAIGIPILGDLKYTPKKFPSMAILKSHGLDQADKMHLHLLHLSIPSLPMPSQDRNREGEDPDQEWTRKS